MFSMLAPTDATNKPATNGQVKTVTDDVFVLPATVGQQGFWYLDQLQPGNPAYNIAVRFHLQGSLDPKKLECALNDIVARHEALRTLFAVQEGVPVQVISSRLSIDLKLDDVRTGSAQESRQRADALAKEEASRRFDLGKGPLIRARLIRQGGEEHMLLVTIHHIVADGWSIGILTRELAAFYDSRCSGRDSPLPDLTIQCGDFAIWQEEWLQSQDLSKQIDYWRQKLAKLPLLEIPSDRPRAATQTFRGSIESILLPKDLTNAIGKLAHREKVTPFTVMLAVFKVLLRQCTNQDDIYVGSVFAGRPRVELEPLIGMFINPLVLRTDLSGDPSFVELLPRVRDTVLQAFANQDVPFERVVEAVQPRRDPSRHPVFQINFLYQRDFVQPFEASGLTMTPIPSVSPGSIYDLNFFMVERADGWRTSCEYNTDLYQVTTIRRMLRQFEDLLEQITAKPNGRIAAFTLKLPDPQDRPAVPTNKANAPIAQSLPPSCLAKSTYVAPRNETEGRLVEIWERILGAQGLGVTADFFDSGGHSLLAARLIAQIQKAFGTQLSLATLLQAPTIEALAERLTNQQDIETSDAARLGDGEWEHPEDQVFPMRREGTRPPLILVDAGPMYRPLVRKLGNDQPVFGMALPRLSDLPKPFTVKDIAANLVEALCATQIKGPYCLAGWSTAGVIAYEMAQQLRGRGQEVALLVLFDTNSPAYIRAFSGWRKLPFRTFFVLEKFFYHLRKLRGNSWRAAWRSIRERMHKFELKAPVPQPDAEKLSPEETSDELFRYSWQVQYYASINYDPEPNETPVVLVRSEVLQTGWFRDPLLGWGKPAYGGLQLIVMPGEHDSMFQEPDVERLAATVNKCLKRMVPGQQS
jgi:thioesterase domain-containing protein/acyl carrier protein